MCECETFHLCNSRAFQGRYYLQHGISVSSNYTERECCAKLSRSKKLKALNKMILTMDWWRGEKGDETGW